MLAFKVRDLVAHLLTGDQEAEVVVFGYFGEKYEVGKHDFQFLEIKPRDNPQGIVGSFLRVEVPDIGPEPT
jgi:hypothetical protein